MSSSQAEQPLVAITTAYRQAVGAYPEQGLAAVEALLDQVDKHLLALPDMSLDPGTRALQQDAQAARQELVAALAADRQATAEALRQQRQAQRLLGAYGGRMDRTGSRVEGAV